jgi:hypothetical protein
MKLRIGDRIKVNEVMEVYYGRRYYEIPEEVLIEKGWTYIRLMNNGMIVLTQREYADTLGRDKFPNARKYKFVKG